MAETRHAMEEAGRRFAAARVDTVILIDPLLTHIQNSFEEKLLFALLWNRNLHGFWRQELGEGFLAKLKRLVPYTWVIDPSPLPPHGAIPGSRW